ncbi:alkaline phosphatase [Baekduia sp. Peel2402]|uniref:alkaline phosphatase n=1 Tax=Baekduia sp. Peel2402 TaxID=3458296 RepID=UPI00403ECA46
MTLSRLPVALGGLGAVVVLGVGASFAVGGTDNPTNDTRAALDGSKPKNVILFIGDGMGTQEVTAARYYNGATNRLNFDRLKFTGFDTTWSVKPAASAPYTPDYAPDSASTGTEWATGRKTLDERISQGPSPSISTPGENYKTVMEEWQAAGKRVGNVSTAEITDATPAVQASHISLRGCQGPTDTTASCATETKAAGGPGSIAEQEVDHKLDVILGGGRSRFEQPITGGPDAGKTVVQSAQGKGYQYVTDANGLTGLTDKSKPVLGLFKSGTMSQEWTGPAAQLGKGNTPVACTEGARPANEPSLTAMTTKAINLLDDGKGFFLQVEGASIDKRDHAADACGQIGETLEMDRALGVALDYQASHPDTLVVVTADHSHTSQIVAEDADSSATTGLPTGYSSNVLTKDGQTLSLTYGTVGYRAGQSPVADPSTLSQQHTGSVVPVWAIGPQASAVLGTNDHTDLFDLLRGAKVAQTAPSTTTTVTQTVPGPTTTVVKPAPVGKPRIALAVRSGATRKSGVAVSVAAVDAKTVKVTLKQGTKTLATKSLSSKGGSATLGASKAKKGTVKITVSASGAGGSATKSASLKLAK